jgi:hypothetical protein
MVKNQTEEKWLEFSNPEDLGTGIFLIPDVKSDKFGAAQKLVVPDITYPQCVQRGMFTIAFKWVPHSVASASELEVPCEQQCNM